MTLQRALQFTLVLMLLCLVISCATRKERAQRHFDKAISLDPSLIRQSMRLKDSVRFQDSLRIKDSIHLIPKTVFTGNLGNPCDSNGKLKPFDYTFGAGPTRARIWSDASGLHYYSATDSLLSRTKELERSNAILKERYQGDQQIIQLPGETIYKNNLWELVCAAVVGGLLVYFRGLFSRMLNR